MQKAQTNSDFEPVDNTPVAIPTRLRLPQTRTDQMREFIRQEMSRAAAENGAESFEEADDIEPDDEENLPLSPYELMSLEPPPPIDEGKGEAQPPADPAAKPEVPPSVSPTGDNDGKK